MKVNTVRFGEINVEASDVITFPEGLLGFEHLKRFFIVDPADETLILWLQSVDSSEVAFPVLEPKIFKGDYKVRLSANELRQLQLDGTAGSGVLVYTILTIPDDITKLTANLKAPVVINTKNQRGRQVILQETEYSVRYSMYKELLAVIMSAGNAQLTAKGDEGVAPLSLRTASSRVEVVAL